MPTTPFKLFVALAIASAHFSTTSAAPNADGSRVFARQYITPANVQEQYDYVIAGGGLAGLVIASRLSENANNRVLVLEAGLSGDAVKDDLNTPQDAYFASIVGTDYDWKHVTVRQPNMNNRDIYWPRGRTLGGSTAMNAMYLVRPAKEEVNAWESLIAEEGDATAAKRWGWDSLYKYMRKAENFTPPIPALAPTINITFDASTHGSGGPMQISYPAVQINIVGNWTRNLAAIGVPENPSPNGGDNLGGMISPSSINPTNWTRSYSRPAYIDSLPPRPNLHILSEATVVRFVLSDQKDKSGKFVAEAVEYAKDENSPRSTVKVAKEVIVTGGALGSPKILMYSGVGPADVLAAANVPVKVDLPGVGQNLQDHITAPVEWETPFETIGDLRNANSDFSRTPEFRSCINDAVAFVNLSRLFGNGAEAFRQDILEQMDESVQTRVPSTNGAIRAGYRAIYDITGKLLPSAAQVELLMSVITPGRVSVQSALQHPYSKGYLYINSSNPFDPVVIDPKYFSHPADRIIIRQGIKLVRELGAAFGATFGREISPGPDVQTDEQIDAWLSRQGANTQYHPASSCPMMPQKYGGVVDANLRVYGLANVRVADASIFPFEFAAHLASATFGVAETASDILKTQTYSVASRTASFARPIAIPGAHVLSTLCLALVALLFV